MASKIDQAFSFQQRALGLRAYRQQVLAGNIANADTPNYKARDFDFSAALKEAVAGRTDAGGLPMSKTNSGHMSPTSGSGPVSLLYRTPMQASVDGNTVEMDVERAQFSENAIRYEAGLRFLGGRIKTLMSAIQGQSS